MILMMLMAMEETQKGKEKNMAEDGMKEKKKDGMVQVVRCLFLLFITFFFFSVLSFFFLPYFFTRFYLCFECPLRTSAPNKSRSRIASENTAI